MTDREEERDRRYSRSRRSGRYRHVEEDYEHPWQEPRLMDLARKLVRGGAEIVVSTQGALRDRASDIRAKEIPKELVESVAQFTARTKDEMTGMMAKEFKNYLEKLDLVGEFRSILEQYTLDVNMTIRLRPNEDGEAEEPHEVDEAGVDEFEGESDEEEREEGEPDHIDDREEPDDGPEEE